MEIFRYHLITIFLTFRAAFFCHPSSVFSSPSNNPCVRLPFHTILAILHPTSTIVLHPILYVALQLLHCLRTLKFIMHIYIHPSLLLLSSSILRSSFAPHPASSLSLLSILGFALLLHRFRHIISGSRCVLPTRRVVLVLGYISFHRARNFRAF